MSLTSTLQGSVETIYKVLDELVVLGTYNPTLATRTYDPETDTYLNETGVARSVRIIETSVAVEEREASPVTVEDVKVLIPFVDLVGVDIVESDTITYNGTTKNILARKKVPGKAIHIFFVRNR